MCLHSRRLQVIDIDCERNLQRRQRTLYKKKYCLCTSYKAPRTFKSGVHLFAALENSLKCLVWVSQCRSSNFTSVTGFSVLAAFAWHSFDRFRFKKIERIVRVSLHAGELHVIRPLHWDLNFDFECPRAVRCTWTKWHWKPVHSSY